MSEISSTEKPIGVIDAQRLHDTFNDEFDTEYDRRAKTHQRLVDRVKELEQQRDAALKLAEKWESDDYGTLFSDFSNELRAIFEPKEGK